MNLCKGCSESAHRILPATVESRRKRAAECECGCHQVTVLEEYDKGVWWLPAEDLTIAIALAVRERPRLGFHLTYFYMGSSPLGKLGPWVEGSEMEMDPKQINALTKTDIDSPSYLLSTLLF